jgi:hypothetical protein
MKITFGLLTILLVLAFENAFCQKQIFEVPNLKAILQTQKTVAILPLKVTISFKRMPKNYDAASNEMQEKEEGGNMQQGMYTYLLRKSKDFTVSFQEVQRTNILLKQAGVFDKLETITPDSICKILKVDGLIQASYAYEKTGSEGVAVAMTLLVGFSPPVASGALTMQIYNGPDGIMLWRFYKEMNEGAFTSADALMERMMKKVARNFPYEK